MMIDPEYYKERLKKKTAAQIMTEIHRLKNAIGRLKNTMEYPKYEKVVVKSPRDSVRIEFMRQYLERAKEALSEAGGTYIPSQAELKAKAFDDRIPLITKMELSMYNIHGQQVRTISIEKDIASLTFMQRFAPELARTRQIDKEMFFDTIEDLHIGEWRRRYAPERYGIMFLDGTWWNLNIYFRDDCEPITICGDNVYPYNFKKLYECFDIDQYSEG